VALFQHRERGPKVELYLRASDGPARRLGSSDTGNDAFAGQLALELGEARQP